MSQPVWLEVALNGPWGRETQPGIPITPEEIIEEAVACAHEGAAIVHLHAYDVATGRQRDDADLYARIIEGVEAAFVSRHLFGVRIAVRDQERRHHQGCANQQRHADENRNWQVVRSQIDHRISST